MNECKHKNTYYTVKRMRLLEHLLGLGFEVEKTIPDPENPKYKWWLIKNTPELESAISNYFSK